MGKVKKRAVERGVFSRIRLFLNVSQALCFSLMVMDGPPLWNNGTHINVQHSEARAHTHNAHFYNLQALTLSLCYLLRFLVLVHLLHNLYKLLTIDGMKTWNNRFETNSLHGMKMHCVAVRTNTKNMPQLRLNVFIIHGMVEEKQKLSENMTNINAEWRTQ